MNLYDNLYELCSKQNLTPSGLCVELGISKTIVSKLKNDEHAQLSYKTAKKMADRLGVPVDLVLHGANENIPADYGEDDIELLDRINARPELKILMHNGAKATPEQIAQINALLESFIK